jgi:hypothetical protein
MSGRRLIAAGQALLENVGSWIRLANRQCYAIERAAEGGLRRLVVLHRRLVIAAGLILLANLASCGWLAHRYLPALAQAIEDRRPGPFEVTIHTAESRVAVQKPFDVHVRIVNPGREPRGFTVERDGWGTYLRSSHPDLRCRRESWGEPLDRLEVVSLAPGESYEKTVKLVVSDKAPGRVTFRLGFTPMSGPWGTSWSNKLTLQVESDGLEQTNTPQ